jgi:hypothetical protein
MQIVRRKPKLPLHNHRLRPERLHGLIIAQQPAV